MQLFHFWSFDVHPVQNLLLCIKISSKFDNFSLRYGDITIFKMAAVRHLGIVLPPYETTHEVPVKFYVNLVHRYEDIAISIFSIFGLICLFRPPKRGF